MELVIKNWYTKKASVEEMKKDAKIHKQEFYASSSQKQIAIENRKKAIGHYYERLKNHRRSWDGEGDGWDKALVRFQEKHSIPKRLFLDHYYCAYLANALEMTMYMVMGGGGMERIGDSGSSIIIDDPFTWMNNTEVQLEPENNEELQITEPIKLKIPILPMHVLIQDGRGVGGSKTYPYWPGYDYGLIKKEAYLFQQSHILVKQAYQPGETQPVHQALYLMKTSEISKEPTYSLMKEGKLNGFQDLDLDYRRIKTEHYDQYKDVALGTTFAEEPPSSHYEVVKVQDIGHGDILIREANRFSPLLPEELKKPFRFSIVQVVQEGDYLKWEDLSDVEPGPPPSAVGGSVGRVVLSHAADTSVQPPVPLSNDADIEGDHLEWEDVQRPVSPPQATRSLCGGNGNPCTALYDNFGATMTSGFGARETDAVRNEVSDFDLDQAAEGFVAEAGAPIVEEHRDDYDSEEEDDDDESEVENEEIQAENEDMQ